MHADLIVANANVYTVDPNQPRADAVAVTGNRITAVGSEAEVMVLRGSDTRMIDGQGNTLMPGIIDSHFHLFMGSMGINALRLEEVKSLAELTAVLQQHAADNPDLAWIEGGGLAYDVAGGESLSCHHLDAILPERPIMLRSMDMHTAWVNTMVLQQADLMGGRELPMPSEIILDADGVATGQLNEMDAMEPVIALMPQPSRDEELALLRRGLAELASFGITSVHNMFGDAHQFELYATLEQAGDLTSRVYVPFHITPEMSPDVIVREAIPLREQYTSKMLRGGSVKIFMDGVIESFTSLMIEPYANQPDSIGDALFTADQFNALALEADRHGFQIKVHAIGDGAVRRTLDGFAHARVTNGKRDSRHRIEHVELLHNDDLPRFADLDVIAAMQPLHASRPDIDYYGFWMKCVGPERYHASFRWRDLADAGVPICLGSDWPVVTMDPYAGIEAAVNQQAWAPGLVNQALGVEETLAGYTKVGAYAEFMETEKGQVRAGMLADLLLLDADIFAVEPEKIGAVRPLMTICDGRVVFEE